MSNKTSKLPPFIETFSKLIATPSVSSYAASLDMSNRPIIDVLANWFSTLGFSISIQSIDSGKANLIATIGKGSGGLVLAGHTDTVPFDESLWQSDPLEVKEKDNRLHGLGSSDMKGFFSVILEAIQQIELDKLQKPLIILATADEESSMSGARALATADPINARYALIGEPTNLKPVRMHKGVMMESIKLSGRSGHSSNPALGVNSLDAMHQVIAQLMALREKWGQKYQHPAFEVEYPTMNLASIHGGDAPNRICEHCELRFDVRLLPGMPSDVVRNEIQTTLDKALENQSVKAEFKPLFKSVEAFLEPETSELVSFAEQLTGHSAGNAGFATEAPFLQALGMQTLVMGPGSIDCAHQANEYLPLEQIDPAINMVKSMIHKYCF